MRISAGYIKNLINLPLGYICQLNMKITNKETKIVIEWDINSPEEIKEANEYFRNLTRQGWIAVIENDKPTRLLEFKKDAGKILFIPLAEGG